MFETFNRQSRLGALFRRKKLVRSINKPWWLRGSNHAAAFAFAVSAVYTTVFSAVISAAVAGNNRNSKFTYGGVSDYCVVILACRIRVPSISVDLQILWEGGGRVERFGWWQRCIRGSGWQWSGFRWRTVDAPCSSQDHFWRLKQTWILLW